MKKQSRKVQYDLKREAAKMSPLWSGKITKYKYLTSEKILLPQESRIIEQAKFTYSLRRKALENK